MDRANPRALSGARRRPAPLLARVGAALAIAALATNASRAHDGQPADPPPPSDASGASRAQDRPPLFDREVLMERLRRRLDEVQRERSMVEGALARLEKGDSPREVMRDLRPGMPGGMGPRGLRPGVGPGEGPMRPEGRGMGRDHDGPPHRPGEGAHGRGPESARMDPGAMIDALRERAPRLAEALERARQQGPEEFERMMSRWAPRLREAMVLRERDPEMFRLRVEELQASFGVFEAVRAARVAGQGPEAERARERVREAVGAQFEARLAVQAREVESLTKRLDELKSRVEKQRTDRASAIDRVTERLLGGEGLDGPMDGPADQPGPKPRE